MTRHAVKISDNGLLNFKKLCIYFTDLSDFAFSISITFFMYACNVISKPEYFIDCAMNLY